MPQGRTARCVPARCLEPPREPRVRAGSSRGTPLAVSGPMACCTRRTHPASLAALRLWLAIMLALLIAAPAQATPASVTYDPARGTVIRTYDGRWEFNPYAMVQLTHTTAGAGAVTDTGFRLRVARLIFHVNALTPALVYHVQINAADGRGKAGRRLPALASEAMAGSARGADRGDAQPAAHHPGGLPGAGRAVAHRCPFHVATRHRRDRVSLRRRTQVRGDPRHLQWRRPEHHQRQSLVPGLGAARVQPPGAPSRFREADLDDTPRPKLSLALAGAFNPERIDPSAADPSKVTVTRDIAQAVAELTLRVRGLSVTEETHVRRRVLDRGRPAVDVGAFAQIGWFILPDPAAGGCARVARRG